MGVGWRVGTCSIINAKGRSYGNAATFLVLILPIIVWFPGQQLVQTCGRDPWQTTFPWLPSDPEDPFLKSWIFWNKSHFNILSWCPAMCWICTPTFGFKNMVIVILPQQEHIQLICLIDTMCISMVPNFGGWESRAFWEFEASYGVISEKCRYA